MRRLAARIGIVVAAASSLFTVGIAGCASHDTMPPLLGYGGYGSMPGNLSVAEPAPYTVESMPPEPLYEQMTPAPGPGWVWIDGYWHWDGAEWVWVPGRWEHQQDGYVYVQPDYEYAGERYVYTPGYWSLPAHVPRGWSLVRDHRTGRPPTAAPPVHQPSQGMVVPPRTRPGGGGVMIPQPPSSSTLGGGSVILKGPHAQPVYIPAPSGTIRGTDTTIGRQPVAREPVAPPVEPAHEPVYGPPTAAPSSPPPTSAPTVIVVPSRPTAPPPHGPHPGGSPSAPMHPSQPPPIQAPPPSAPMHPYGPPPTVQVPAPAAPIQQAPVHPGPATPTTPTTPKHH